MSACTKDSFDKILADNIGLVVAPQDAKLSPPQHGVCIPSKKYQQGTGYGSLNNQGLVLFFLEDGSYLPVNMALREEYTRLINRGVHVLAGTGNTVSVQLEWPGYLPYISQLRTINYCVPAYKITLSKLATLIAKIVDKFVKGMEGVVITPDQAEWRIGQDGIQIQDLHLVALEQVSRGTWQVRLFYKPTH